MLAPGPQVAMASLKKKFSQFGLVQQYGQLAIANK